MRYILLILAVSIASPVFGATLVAKKKKVKVFDQASKKASVLGEIKKGDSLEASERKGMYWKVEFQSKPAYVSVTKVRRQPSKSSSLSKAIRAAAQSARTTDEVEGTRARSAVMGVRGLSDSDNVMAAGNVSPNTRIVYQMEDREINPDELEAFGEAVFAEVERRASRK